MTPSSRIHTQTSTATARGVNAPVTEDMKRPSLVKIHRSKSVGQSLCMLYVLSFLTYLSGIFHGIYLTDFVPSILMIAMSGFGSVAMLVYLAVFARYALSDVQRRSHMICILYCSTGFVVILALFVGIVFIFAHHAHLRRDIFSIAYGILSVIMYWAPLAVLKTVWDAQEIQLISFLLPVILSLRCAFFFAYGFVITPMSWTTLIPNGAGAFLALVQIVVYILIHCFPQFTTAIAPLISCCCLPCCWLASLSF
ncbi:hypothetical protein Droror1_Dr00010185 [Drosera rotundifolia]